MEQQSELSFSPSSESSVRVLTLRQFLLTEGYDVDISHDRLRFPHGISKRQERDNRRASEHHWAEFCRGARAYSEALQRGDVRPPTGNEMLAAQFLAHPDHESTKATWRVAVKRLLRADASLQPLAAVERIIRERLDGLEVWPREMGVHADDIAAASAARFRWMQLPEAA